VKMKYNIEKMISDFESGEPLEFLFFRGHEIPGEGIGKQCLSQWYNSSFKFEGTLYRTSEHWMMAQKARLFKDPVSFQKIIESGSPKIAKLLGREVKGFSPGVWDEHKYKIVFDGNVHKFTQNPGLFQYLKGTKGRYLIEANPYDSIWGIGISEECEGIDNPCLWKGQNLLGFVLMEVRDQLEEME